MRRALLLAAVLISGSLQGVSAQDLSGTLIVANRNGGSVSLFDLEASVEIARLPIGPVIPHEVAVSPDGALALTSEYGSADRPGRHVVLIDIKNAVILGRIDLGPSSRPHSTAFLPDGRRAVATMEASDQLALIDIRRMQVERVFSTGGREGHMVRLSPDGRRAYVTSRGAEGTLSVIYLDDERPPTVIPTAAGAEGLAVAPDGSEVWVVNRLAGSISIVDTQMLAVVGTIEAPPRAGRAEISADGWVLVPNGTSAQPVPKFLSIYDYQSRRIVERISMNAGEPGRGAYSIHVLDEIAFIADRASQSIEIRRFDDFGNPRLLATHHDGPDGLAYSPVRVAAMGR